MASREDTLGPRHVDTGLAYHNLGCCLALLGQVLAAARLPPCRKCEPTANRIARIISEMIRIVPP